MAAGLIVMYLLMNIADLGTYRNKLWLHRTNSVEKMQENKELYRHIEIDITYRGKGLFDVTHDADTTFNQNLEEYLPIVQKRNKAVWLDIKNLHTDNAAEMLTALERLLKTYRLEQDHFIIEASDTAALRRFTQKGFYTSYYVPFDKPSRLGEAAIEAAVQSLQRIADSGAVHALSFPIWWYDTLKKKLDRPIDLLAWSHRTTQLQFLLIPGSRDILRDPQLKVILLKKKGKYHR